MMEYRIAKKIDIPSCASLYIDGFRQQLHSIFGKNICENLFVDFLSFVSRVEKDGFIVACENNNVVGFSIMTKNPVKFFLKISLLSFFPCIWGMLSGRYRGINIYKGLSSFFDFLKFFNVSKKAGKKYKKAGQVITMVVSENMRGQGIGGKLLNAGIEYLKKHTSTVKLEVRADNAPAIHLYKKNGFFELGRVKSKVGTSIIMIKNL